MGRPVEVGEEAEAVIELNDFPWYEEVCIE
jgi:hypothetical protein